MSSIVGIRTYRWGDEEQRLYDTLHPVLGDNLVAIVQNPATGLDLPLDMIALTDDWLDEQGLRQVSNWGWRCGDYAYYALRAGRPGYDFYWMIEPDVFFSSSPAPFFAAFEDIGTDVLGLEVREFGRDHRFARGMPDMDLYVAIFALTRISARALDRLFDLRVASAGDDVLKRDYPNDETFVFSNAVADPEFSVGELREIAPEWFAESTFATDPDILVDSLVAGNVPAGRLYHPVRSREGFRGALAARLTTRLKFLEYMAPSLAELDDEDIDTVIMQTGAVLRRHIKRARRIGWAEKRKID